MTEDQVKRLVLAPFGEEWSATQVTDLTWNLTQLPTGAKHWYVVIERASSHAGDYDTMRDFQVFWWQDRVAILPLHPASVDSQALWTVFYGGANGRDVV